MLAGAGGWCLMLPWRKSDVVVRRAMEKRVMERVMESDEE